MPCVAGHVIESGEGNQSGKCSPVDSQWQTAEAGPVKSYCNHKPKGSPLFVPNVEKSLVTQQSFQ